MSRFTPEQIQKIAEIVDQLGLSAAERRLLAGHDDPCPACAIDGIGRLAIVSMPEEEIPFTLGLAIAQLSPILARLLVAAAVDATASRLLSNLGPVENSQPKGDSSK